MKVLTSTISLKLYFVFFIMGAIFLMFNLTSCGTTKRYKTTFKSHSFGLAGVNRVSNVHIYPGY